MGVVGVAAKFTRVGVAGKLPTVAPLTTPTTGAAFLLLVSCNFAFFERDFVDFLLTFVSDDLFGSSAEPPPVVFIFFICL